MSNLILVDDGYYASPVGGDIAVVVCGNPCYFYAATVVNFTSSDIFAMLFDQGTAPTAGKAPITQLQVKANSQASISKQLPLYRWRMTNGLCLAASSTATSYTAVGSKSMMLYCYYTV
jgi:hypothetical protein